MTLVIGTSAIAFLIGYVNAMLWGRVIVLVFKGANRVASLSRGK